jgi:DnaJ-class molecular chaperone
MSTSAYGWSQFEPEEWETCDNCDGEGRLTCQTCFGSGQEVQPDGEVWDCPACEAGEGKIECPAQRCRGGYLVPTDSTDRW